MEQDYAEQHDLGEDPAYATIRSELHEHLFRWLRTRKHRTARTDAQIIAGGGEAGPRSLLIRQAGFGRPALPPI
jgi:hypothetical protein